MTTTYVSPTGAGNLSGTSFANAKPGDSVTLQAIHDAGAHGDSIRLLAGPGYTATVTLNWTKRIGLSGYLSNGTSRGQAIITGARTYPWPVNGLWTDSGRYTAANGGLNFINYKDAAAASGGTTFDYLTFTHLGTPFRPLFGSSSVTGQITVSNIWTYNTNGCVYVESSGDGQCSITGTSCRAVAYSEGQFRAFGNMYLSDCHGDARSQFHSPSTNLFGAHVQDAIVGVTVGKYAAYFRNCTYLNHNAAPPAGSSKDPATTGNYMQGDGIVCEENTDFQESYNLTLRNNGDRGIDLKCAVPEGGLHHVFADGNGYDVAAHDDLVETYITDSFLGSTFRAPYDTRKSAPLQGSGHLTAVRCVIEQTNSGTTFPGVWYGSVQPQHVQSGVTIPQRTGKGVTRDCVLRMKSGATEAVNSAGGSPQTTPTYTRTGNSRVETI